MEKDPAIFEEINYYVTCDLIFPTISYIYTVKCVIVLAVIHMSLSVLVCSSGAEKDQFKEVRKRLQESKLYLKTT